VHVGHAHRRRHVRLHHRLGLVGLHGMLGRSGSWGARRCRSRRRRTGPAGPHAHRRRYGLGCRVVHDGQLWRRALVRVPRTNVHVMFAGHYRPGRHPRTLLFQSLVLYGQLGFGRLAGDARPGRLLRLAEGLLRRFRRRFYV
jgi:hypothetical protein